MLLVFGTAMPQVIVTGGTGIEFLQYCSMLYTEKFAELVSPSASQTRPCRCTTAVQNR